MYQFFATFANLPALSPPFVISTKHPSLSFRLSALPCHFDRVPFPVISSERSESRNLFPAALRRCFSQSALSQGPL